MKLKGYSKDRSAKPCELGDFTFYVKPLDRNLRMSFEGRSSVGLTEIFTPDVKQYFAKRNVTGWDGVVADDGSKVEYSPETAVTVLTDEENEDLFYELYNYAYKLAVTSDQSQEKDAEAAKKK